MLQVKELANDGCIGESPIVDVPKDDSALDCGTCISCATGVLDGHNYLGWGEHHCGIKVPRFIRRSCSECLASPVAVRPAAQGLSRIDLPAAGAAGALRVDAAQSLCLRGFQPLRGPPPPRYRGTPDGCPYLHCAGSGSVPRPKGLGNSCPPPSSTATACRTAAESSRCARKRFCWSCGLPSLRSAPLGLRRPAAGRTQTRPPTVCCAASRGPLAGSSATNGGRRRRRGAASGCFIFLDRAPTCRCASPAGGLAGTPRSIKKNAALRWHDLRTT